MLQAGVRPRLRGVAAPFAAIVGAGLGAGWDLMHVRTETTSYRDMGSGQPRWVLAEFAAVYLAGVFGIARFGRPAPDESSPVRAIGEAMFVSVAYATTAVLHRRELLVCLVLLALLALRRDTVARIVAGNPLPSVALVAGGPLVESVLIWSDVFSYERASLGPIPLWLPLLYACAVPFAVRLTETALRWFGTPSTERAA